MKVCPNCFNSNYLASIIQRSKDRGKCGYCQRDNVPLFEDSELIIFFRGIFDLYIPFDKSVHSSSIIPQTLEHQLLIDFPEKLFNSQDPVVIKRLITGIMGKEDSVYKEIIDKPVVLDARYSLKSKQKAADLQHTWDKFSREIISQNRFHIKNAINLENLSKLLKRHVREYLPGKSFFRSRISGKEGHPANKMANPNNENARAGRANPQGISYLYLSSDEITTMYEVRAIKFDYVTIAEFELMDKISIINLRETEIFDPIELSEKEEIEDFIVHLPFISKLQDELSMPIRRFDDELNYLPTQYLSEFIKSLGYDGIEFKSSQNSKGYNLAIFNPQKFECVDLKIYEMNEILFRYQEVDRKE